MEPITGKQLDYILILFNDVGITGTTKQLAYAASLLGRKDLAGFFELSKGEAGALITSLLKKKRDVKDAERNFTFPFQDS